MNTLFRILLISLSFLLLVGCSTGGKLSPSEAWSKINAGVVLVDVRTESGFKSGHLEGAKNIPLDTIKANPLGVDLDSKQELVLYCRSGNRAGQAEEILRANGFRKVYNAGGYSDLKSRKPVS
jgi:phage shock protein E